MQKVNELLNEMILLSIDGSQDALISCFKKGKKWEEHAAVLKKKQALLLWNLQLRDLIYFIIRRA